MAREALPVPREIPASAGGEEEQEEHERPQKDGAGAGAEAVPGGGEGAAQARARGPAVLRAGVVTVVLTLALDSAKEHMTASMKTWAWQTFIEGHETTRIIAGQLHLLPDVFPEKLGPMRLVEVPSLHELF